MGDEKRGGFVMSATGKMQKARIALILQEPFFGALLLNLKSMEDRDGKVCETMATDGKSLWWHTAFVDSLSEREVKTVLAHEVLHCALLHPLRRGTREPKRWNIACDHAVNLQLEDCNEMARGKGKTEPFPWPKLEIFCDTDFAGISAEEIYNRLPRDGGNDENGQGTSGKGSQGDSEGMGGVRDVPGDEAEKKEQEASWKVAMVQAVAAAKMAGNLPAGIKRLVDDTLHPPARWQDILRELVQDRANDDYSWTRPNPRYAHTGFILPSLYSQRLGRIAVAVDTSGSIDEELLNRFLGELEGICAECRPSSVTLIDCDTEVNSVRECDPSDPLPRDFAGGGGTDFRPVFERVAEDPPVCLIYFTDLDGTFPEHEPSFPVFWATYNTGKTAPFGVTVKLG